MRRGTTPTYTFTLPFETSGVVRDLRVSLAQDGKTIIDKKLEDCTLGERSISLTLSQEDTLKLKSGRQVRVQVKIITLDGNVIANNPIVIECLEILNEEVL